MLLLQILCGIQDHGYAKEEKKIGILDLKFSSLKMVSDGLISGGLYCMSNGSYV